MVSNSNLGEFIGFYDSRVCRHVPFSEKRLSNCVSRL